MTLHQSVYIDWKLFIWLQFFILWSLQLKFLSIDAMKFFIFLWRISLWLWHHAFEYIFAPPFFSLIIFQSKTFLALSLFRDWCLKNFFDIKLNVRRYIRSSIRMYQDQSRILARHAWQAWRYIYNNQTLISRFHSHWFHEMKMEMEMEMWEWNQKNKFIYPNKEILKCKKDHRTPLVWWWLHKYKCLWGVGGKGRDLSIQEGGSHTYTLRLG